MTLQPSSDPLNTGSSQNDSHLALVGSGLGEVAVHPSISDSSEVTMRDNVVDLTPDTAGSTGVSNLNPKLLSSEREKKGCPAVATEALLSPKDNKIWQILVNRLARILLAHQCSPSSFMRFISDEVQLNMEYKWAFKDLPMSVVSPIVLTIQTHNQAIGLVLICFRALAMLSSSPRVAEAFVGCRHSLSDILKLCGDNMKNVQLQLLALFMLRNLTYHEPVLVWQFYDNNGVHFLLDLSRMHQKNSILQTVVLELLSNVTCGSSFAREHAVSVAWIERIFDISCCFKDLPQVQTEVVRSVLNVALHLTDTIKYVVSAGGLQRLLNISERFEDTAEVQTQVACSLAQVAWCGQDLTYEVTSKGGVLRLLRISERHKGNPSMQRQAMQALGNLAVNSMDARNLILEQGGMWLMLDIVMQHHESPSIVQAGLFALDSLAFCNVETHYQEFDSIRAKQTLQRILKLHEDNMGIRTIAKTLLSKCT